MLAASVALTVMAAGTEPVGRPVVRIHAQEDYRGHQRVHAMAQTPDGLVYATNYAGLREWDGQRWRRIAVPTSWIVDVAAGPDGRVWAAVFDDLGYAGPTAPGAAAKEWVSLRDRLPAGSPPVGQIVSVVWHAGAAWWGGADRVWRWDGKEMQTWHFPDHDGAVCQLRAGGRELYLHRRGDALYRWGAGEWQVVSRAPELVGSTLALAVDDWTGGRTLGLDGEGRGWLIEATKAERSPLPAVAALAGVRVNRGLRLSDGSLLLCTADRGIVRLDATGNLAGQYGEEAGLPSVVTLGACEDAERGVWVGTQTSLARINLFSAVTEVPPPSRAAGIFFRLQRHAGRLHARGDDGVYRLDESVPARARWEKLPGLSALALDILSHPRGLLIGTEAGLAGVDASGAVVPLLSTASAVHTLTASQSDPDRIFAGRSDGVSVLRHDGVTWRDEGRLPGVELDARSILEDAAGNLWVGAPSKGIARLRRSPGQADWSHATFRFYRAGEAFPAGYIVFADTADGPVFSCPPALLRHDEASDRFVPAESFPTTPKGERWIGQFSGTLERLWFQSGVPAGYFGDIEAEKPTDLGALERRPDGRWDWRPLPPTIVRQMDFYGAYSTFWESTGGGPEGVLWVPTARRVLRIDVAAARAESSVAPAPVIIRAAEGDGADLSRHPTLPYTRALLHFTFASPRHAPGTRMEFRYRLRGYDSAWSGWSPETSAGYTNLSGGSFRFEVEARDESGRAAAPAALAFTMALPWHRQPAAWALYALGLVGAGTGLFRWRLAAARREQRRLEALVEARTADWREAKDRAEAASRAKTLFLASMSHELRTPLHAILGYARMLGEDREASPRVRDRLRVVESSGQHLLQLIGNVLDLSKLEVGASEFRGEPIDLRRWIADVCSGPAARAQAKGLAFSAEVMSDVPETILTDAQKLRQVLDNLLGNAVKFTAQGSVTLRLSRADGRLRLEVIDTGPGIPPMAQARAFRIFAQAEGGDASRGESGAGLGLAIAHRLAALLGGELHVESEGGHGTRFWCDLPLVDAGAQEVSSVSAPPRIVGYLGPRRRVLAVDDVEANRELFRDLLAPLGFEVALAGTAEEALEILGRDRPDLLVLDLRLPGMDGLQLARRLRCTPELEGLKILAASASVLGHDPREALDAGCDGFLPKPFLAEDFLAKLANLLGLTWTEDRTATPTTDAPLAEAARQALAAAASDGDVVALRRELARLRTETPHSSELDALDRLATAYDLDGLLARLESSAHAL